MNDDKSAVAEAPLTITIDEAAKKLGVGRSSLYAAAREGRVPCLKIGRRVLFTRAGFENWLADASKVRAS